MTTAVLARVLSKTGIRAALASTLRWSGVLVLNYHRVGIGSGSLFDRDLWSAAPEVFADQIRFCRRHADLIAPGDLADAIRTHRGKYCLITFDDGYRDNYEVAFPILKTERVPATFFVTTGFIDTGRAAWWDEIAWMVRTSQRKKVDLPGWIRTPVVFETADRQQAVQTLLRMYKTIPADSSDAYLAAVADATGSGRLDHKMSMDLWMTWDMLREMRDAGMTIGGHTVSHPILALTSDARQREEILGCGRRLAHELGEPMRYFSYPVGGPNAFNAITRNILHEAGVEYAFTYYGGFRRFHDWDSYDIRRVPIETYLTDEWFRSIVALPRLFA